ncbi:MAG: hypothetical protein IMW89_17350, partial [Ktedonobacteraceae bacterium]|nr:hypothetical protein [Ktedonobacteraceae bacterium]
MNLIAIAQEKRGSVAPHSYPLHRNCNFLTVWIGQACSNVGDTFALIAMPLPVLQATGSLVQMGLVTVAFREGLRQAPRASDSLGDQARLLYQLGLTLSTLEKNDEVLAAYDRALTFQEGALQRNPREAESWLRIRKGDVLKALER